MPLQSGAFMEQIIRFLMPFFIGTAVDIDAARADILETLAAYGARTRAEFLNAAQIIAFSMSALDTLAEARTAELSPSLRIRFRGCANGLNRATQQNEKALDQRLSCDPPEAMIAQPANDVPDHQVQATLEHATAKIDTSRARLHPQTRAPQPTNKQLWAPAIVDSAQQTGRQPGVASTG